MTGRLIGAAVGGAGVALGGAGVTVDATVGTGASVGTSVATATVAVIAWVAVGAGVQVGSSAVGVTVGVTTSDGELVRVGMGIAGVKADAAASGVAVALFWRSVTTV